MQHDLRWLPHCTWLPWTQSRCVVGAHAEALFVSLPLTKNPGCKGQHGVKLDPDQPSCFQLVAANQHAQLLLRGPNNTQCLILWVLALKMKWLNEVACWPHSNVLLFDVSRKDNALGNETIQQINVEMKYRLERLEHRMVSEFTMVTGMYVCPALQRGYYWEDIPRPQRWRFRNGRIVASQKLIFPDGIVPANLLDLTDIEICPCPGGRLMR